MWWITKIPTFQQLAVAPVGPKWPSARSQNQVLARVVATEADQDTQRLSQVSDRRNNILELQIKTAPAP